MKRPPRVVPFRGPDGAHSRLHRRLLLISYHFPPSPAAGSLRWQKFAGHLAELGWGLDVVTLDPGSVENPEWNRLAELPPDTRVFGVATEEPRWDRAISSAAAVVRQLRKRPHHSTGPHAYQAPGQLIRVRTTLAEHAQQAEWAARAERVVQSIGEAGWHRAVITCGPPHMVHRAGMRVAKALRLPFVMDFRDPWRLVNRLAEVLDTPLWRWLAAWDESRTLPHADLVVANTEAARDAIRHTYPEVAQRIITIPNGFDDEPDLEDRRTARFVIAFSGSIYLDRDPMPLFRACAKVIGRRRLEPRDLGVLLVGNVQESVGRPTMALAREAGIGDFVETIPTRPREEAMRLLAGAAVLVSLPQDSHLAIPSKIYEYMQFDAWVLAINEPESATGRLLEGSDAGVVSPADIEGIAALLGDWYDRYSRGNRPRRLAADARFGRRHQARLLSDALMSVASERRQ